MGMITDLFSVKEKLWEGTDTAVRDRICAELKGNSLYFTTFEVNQQIPKCSGNCGTCASACRTGEKHSIYDKIQSGCSDDLLMPEGKQKRYAVYVKAKELEGAKRILEAVLTMD